MIGVLAKDETDCLAAEVLVKRITNDVGRARFHVPKAWARAGASTREGYRSPQGHRQRGCVAAIVIHDLDRNPQTNALNDPEVLRRELEAIECPPELSRLICIPVEEIEAWFWSDDVTVKLVGPRRAAHISRPTTSSTPRASWKPFPSGRTASRATHERQPDAR